MTYFTDLRAYANRLVENHSKRDEQIEEMRRMFHMEWRDAPKEDWIKQTMSPSAFNAVMGATRLLVSTEPQISVPFDEADEASRQTSEKVERWAKAVWSASGRVTQRPPHYELVLSGLLFGEICAVTQKTADLLAYAKDTGHRGNIARMTQLAARTPYLFRVFNPITCYPDFDGLGVRAVVRRVETTWGEVLDTWGKLAEQGRDQTIKEPGRLDKVTLNDYYDWERRVVWLNNGGDPILDKEHGLEFFPVVAQITEGAALFDAPERQRFPLLYALHRSGLWKRENLGLTTLYSLVFALASNPLLVQETDALGEAPHIDRTVPGGILQVLPGQAPKPLMEKVIDPSLVASLDRAAALTQESTITRQALGAPPTSGLTFSAISLLAQAGRLPLTATKNVVGNAIAELLIGALKWAKADGGKSKLYRRGQKVELAPDDIPADVMLDVILEPDLPQDKMQMANVGRSIVESRLASRRWVRENILQIGQSGGMDKEIFMEDRLLFEFQKMLQAAAQPPPGQAPGQPLPRPPGEGVSASTRDLGESGPPTSAYPPDGQVGPGQPLAGPLPSREETMGA